MTPKTPTSRRYWLLSALAVAAAVAGLALIVGSGGDQHTPSGGRVESSIGERFTMLSAATSNRCDLAASEVRAMPDSSGLQGACCSAMNESDYRTQLRGLQRFGRDPRIPSDPYDVSVELAKRLLGHRQIELNAQQQRTYRRAAKQAETGGPCCCPCWRWQAFKGQGHFMIARRHYSASQLARLWELEEGCGGEDRRS